jgi:hypothetical protein
MSLLKDLIVNENNCFLCDRDLPNKAIFLKVNEKRVYFCCLNCKVEYQAKKEAQEVLTNLGVLRE